VAPSFDLAVLSSFEKDTLISTLAAQVDALVARVAALETENAALREKLKAPPKTPDNSGTPPSQGRKANGDGKPGPKVRVHAGAHRPLHPNPTRYEAVRAEHCPIGANFRLEVVNRPVIPGGDAARILFARGAMA
jgi:hypothetical protein